MSSAHHRHRPQHFASARHKEGSKRRSTPPIAFEDIPIDFDDVDFGFGPTPVEEEAPTPARVKQSRLALAVAITLAALPVLVLDNFSAQASSPDGVEVEADAPRDTELSRFVRPVAPVPYVVSEVPANTTTVAPATTAAAATTEAPTTTTTEAPTTTKAPVTTKAPTTTAAPATTIAAVAQPRPAGPSPDDPAVWDELAQCEAGGNWAANTGNGYYGGLQFSLATWQDMGGTGYPHEASKATQIQMGKRLYNRSGWAAWPSCARRLGWI